MDPTFRQTMLVFLEALDRAHRDADGTTACTCGDPQNEGRDRHLLDEIAAAFREPEVAPHVVHSRRVTEDYEDIDETDPTGQRTKKTARRVQVEAACPDCTRGLVSRGFDMICSTLSVKTEVRGCHEGCIVACGAVANA